MGKPVKKETREDKLVAVRREIEARFKAEEERRRKISEEKRKSEEKEKERMRLAEEKLKREREKLKEEKRKTRKRLEELQKSEEPVVDKDHKEKGETLDSGANEMKNKPVLTEEMERSIIYGGFKKKEDKPVKKETREDKLVAVRREIEARFKA